MPSHTTRPETQLHEAHKPTYDRAKNGWLSVLCGPNNCGKSFLLRQMVRELGNDASYLGPARYNNFNLLAQVAPNKNRKDEKFREKLNQLENTEQNIDQAPINLSRAIAEMTDEKRKKLIELMDDLLGSNMNVEQTDPNNEMSQKFITVDGYNISYTSSGYRLVATLLTSLLDDDHRHVCIDEPELGISPEIQGILADFLYNKTQRDKHFPHIENLVLATHSPIFLDRQKINNNYYVSMQGRLIQIETINTVQKLNDLQFRLLGNRFETLFLPTAILFVEGKCDFAYIDKLIKLRYPHSQLSVVQCNNDAQIKEKIYIARQMLTDIQKSPYAKRMFVILDQVHGPSLVDSITSMGVPQENVITWDNNGIEYYYPASVLEKRFSEYTELNIVGDKVSANGIEVTKGELSQFVTSHLTPDDQPPEELKTKLLEKLDQVTF